MKKGSIICLQQIRTFDKRRLKEKGGNLTKGIIQKVDIKLRILFEVQKDLLIFILVGSHNDIKKYIKGV